MSCARSFRKSSRCSISAEPHRQAGWALVAVLWTLAMLAMMVAAVEALTLTSARFGHAALEQARLAADIDAGVARAALGIADQRPQQRWRVDGDVRRFRFESDDVEISIQDESGRVDLNAAEPATLKRLLVAAGVPVAQAETLGDNIVLWRTPADDDTSAAGEKLPGAVASDYAEAGLDYGPRRGPFQSVEELNLVLGMTPLLYARLAPALTVYSRAANVNLSVAPPLVQEALTTASAGDDTGPHLLASTAPLIGGNAATTALPGTVPDVDNLAGRSFAITVRARHAGRSLTRDVVILFTDDKLRPYLIEAWH
jgi:general secretion pathway protein K